MGFFDLHSDENVQSENSLTKVQKKRGFFQLKTDNTIITTTDIYFYYN